jgi:ABC-type polar amino acid transport system ATPase subunit
MKERGIGIFLVTHHITFARRAADQVIFMSEGRVAERGDSSILASPRSARLQQFLSMAEIAA